MLRPLDELRPTRLVLCEEGVALGRDRIAPQLPLPPLSPLAHIVLFLDLKDGVRDHYPVVGVERGEAHTAGDPKRLRLVEARAAAVYWHVWASVPVRFARKDKRAVPEHWCTFGSRTLPLTASPWRAANPAN